MFGQRIPEERSMTEKEHETWGRLSLKLSAAADANFQFLIKLLEPWKKKNGNAGKTKLRKKADFFFILSVYFIFSSYFQLFFNEAGIFPVEKLLH